MGTAGGHTFSYLVNLTLFGGTLLVLFAFSAPLIGAASLLFTLAFWILAVYLLFREITVLVEEAGEDQSGDTAAAVTWDRSSPTATVGTYIDVLEVEGPRSAKFGQLLHSLSPLQPERGGSGPLRAVQFDLDHVDPTVRERNLDESALREALAATFDETAFEDETIAAIAGENAVVGIEGDIEGEFLVPEQFLLAPEEDHWLVVTAR